MILLIVGVALWSITHLLPATFYRARSDLLDRLGEGPYKGLFSLEILISLGLIVYGWKTAIPTAIYAPPLSGSPVPAILMVLAVLLFVASALPGNLKRLVRHPQMTAVLLWAAAHLLSNGDTRSLVLFGGFAVWATLEILFINKRDGEWQKPDRLPLTKDIIVVVVTAAVYAALVYFHAPLFGVAAMPV